MADEERGLIGDAPEAAEVQPEPQEALPEQERKTWEGRLRAEQQRMAHAREQLAPYGYTIDEDGQIVGLASQEPIASPQASAYQQQQAPESAPAAAAQEAERWFTWEDEPEAVERKIEARAQRIAQEQVRSAFGYIGPALEQVYADMVRRRYPDWDEISADVAKELQQLGVYNVMQAALTPKLLDTAVHAAKGRRAGAGQRPAAEAEATRKERLEAAESVGAETVRRMRSMGLEFTPEERRFAQEHGLSEEELAERFSSPVTVDILGKKKARK